MAQYVLDCMLCSVLFNLLLSDFFTPSILLFLYYKLAHIYAHCTLREDALVHRYCD